MIVRGAREEEALARSTALARLLQPPAEGVKVIGPAAASIARVKNEYRYQMLLKSASRKLLNETIVALAAIRGGGEMEPDQSGDRRRSCDPSLS